MPSREHKTEAKQTCNKIILLGRGQELPDNLVYASINPGAARSGGSQGELKVAGLTAEDLLKQRYRKQTLKKGARSGAIANDLCLSFCIACNVSLQARVVFLHKKQTVN